MWPVGFKCWMEGLLHPIHPACRLPALVVTLSAPRAVQNQGRLPAASFLYNWGHHLYDYKTKWLHSLLVFLLKIISFLFTSVGSSNSGLELLCFVSCFWFYFFPKMAHVVLITFRQDLEELVLKKPSTPPPPKHVNPLMLQNPSIIHASKYVNLSKIKAVQTWFCFYTDGYKHDTGILVLAFLDRPENCPCRTV